jgi:hypothetical protein
MAKVISVKGFDGGEVDALGNTEEGVVDDGDHFGAVAMVVDVVLPVDNVGAYGEAVVEFDGVVVDASIDAVNIHTAATIGARVSLIVRVAILNEGVARIVAKSGEATRGHRLCRSGRCCRPWWWGRGWLWRWCR